MSDQINIASLKLTVRAFYDVQDLRKKAFNRIGALQRDVGISGDEANWLTEKVFDRIYDVEKNIFKDIAKEVHGMPLWKEWLQYVWGIGETLTGALVAEITDISKFDTISKLWAYGGQHPIAIIKENGETRRWFPTQDEAEGFVIHLVETEYETAKYWAEKRKEKCKYDPVRKKEEYLRRCAWGIHHEPEWIASRRITGLPDNTNSNLKVIAWKCGQQFQKGNPEKSKYRTYYDDAKAYYLNRDTDGKPSRIKGRKSVYITKDGKGEISAGHINNRALRKTVKLLLSHLWVQWRKLEGLPISKPYVIEKMGHQDYIEPFYDSEPES